MSAVPIQDFSLQDLMRPEWRADPYSWYRRLRNEDPVHEDPVLGGWLLTRYTDVAAFLDDDRFSAERLPYDEERGASAQSAHEVFSHQLLFLDPPDHTRLRRLFAKAFTPRRLEAFRSKIVQLTRDMLEEASFRQTCDFIDDIAAPLPVMVIALILGVPVEDRIRLRCWSSAFGSLINGQPMSQNEISHAQQGIAQFRDYFECLIELRRLAPEDDILSDLIAVDEAGDRISKDEMVSNLILVLVAGHRTTTHLLGNGLLAFSSNPAQWNRFVADPEALAPSVVNELLRFDAPVQVTGRLARQDLKFAGRSMPKGARVRALLGSANRDERHFQDPDRLNISRGNPRALAFGHGIHTCLGAVLARIEAQIVFTELVTRFPDLKVKDELMERTSGVTFRGLRHLPVYFP